MEWQQHVPGLLATAAVPFTRRDELEGSLVLHGHIGGTNVVLLPMQPIQCHYLQAAAIQLPGGQVCSDAPLAAVVLDQSSPT